MQKRDTSKYQKGVAVLAMCMSSVYIFCSSRIEICCCGFHCVLREATTHFLYFLLSHASGLFVQCVFFFFSIQVYAWAYGHKCGNDPLRKVGSEDVCVYVCVEEGQADANNRKRSDCL